MPESIKVARIAFVVAAGLEIATAALLVFIFVAGAVLIGWGTERAGLLGSALLGAAGVVLAVAFAAFAVADLLIASGIAKGRPWARIAGTAMAILLLFGFPVGTVLGILALMGLLGRDARDWFGAPRIPRPSIPITPPTV
ncbi:MAG TPA: hypothetical protein VLJ16_08775 [Acidobacteriota bacterium]|nr:hypothetical protein [Acidobacteriota bacterium]